MGIVWTEDDLIIERDWKGDIIMLLLPPYECYVCGAIANLTELYGHFFCRQCIKKWLLAHTGEENLALVREWEASEEPDDYIDLAELWPE